MKMGWFCYKFGGHSRDKKAGVFRESFYLTSLDVCNNFANSSAYVNYVNSAYTCLYLLILILVYN